MLDRIVIVAVVGCVLATLFGCSRSPEPSAAGRLAKPAPAVLLRGNGPEPDSFDPQKARSNEAQSILRDVYECLTSLAKDASVAPGVARDWTVSADGRTYTFRLRPEARWSNGDRVVAADVVAGLRRLVDPVTASSYAQVIDVVTNAREITSGLRPVETLGVQAPDDETVVIQLRAPAPYLPGLLSHPSTCPIHRPTVAARGPTFARPGVTVTNGAFVLTEWVPGSHVLAERNRRYWNDGATRLEVVKYVHIADETAELMRYRAGQLHVTRTAPRGHLDWIRSHRAAELHISPQLSTYYYGFNLDRAPFKGNVKLRRALSLAIDRERLAEHVLRAGERPAYGWVPPGVDNYEAQSILYHGRDMAERVAEARRLYAEAGYSSERPLRAELRYNAGETHERLALAVTAMWRETLGTDVQLVAVEFKSLLEDIDRGDVELFRSSWIGDYNDAHTFAQVLTSSSGVNLPRYRSAVYDALVARATVEGDLRERRTLLEQAEQVMLRDQPIIPLYYYVNKRLVKPEVQGWYDNIMDVVYSRDLALARAVGR